MHFSHTDRLSLNQVARELQVHVATCWRWALRGVRGRRLQTFMIGGRRYVRRSDLDAFLRESDQSPEAPDALQRARDAGKLLDGMGVTCAPAIKRMSE